MKFYVYMPGDQDVNIASWTATVTFEDGLTYDNSMTNSTKELLAEMYDTKVENVLTEAEMSKKSDERFGDVPASLNRLKAKASKL